MRRPRLVAPLELVRSERGSLHCQQAALMMAAKSIRGIDLSWQDAERLTGYRRGHNTWEYVMLANLPSMGIDARVVSASDPSAMAADPVAEIHRTLGDWADSVIEDTDIDAERLNAKRCVDAAGVQFEVRIPNTTDIEQGVDANYLPLVGLDYGKIHDTNKYEGHMVIVTAIDDDLVEIYDPGPPGDEARLINREVFEQAMNSPTPLVGLVILLRASSSGGRTPSSSESAPTRTAQP